MRYFLEKPGYLEISEAINSAKGLYNSIFTKYDNSWSDSTIENIIYVLEKILSETDKDTLLQNPLYAISLTQVKSLCEEHLMDILNKFKLKGRNIDLLDTLNYYNSNIRCEGYIGFQHQLSCDGNHFFSTEFLLRFLKDLKEGRVRLYYALTNNEIGEFYEGGYGPTLRLRPLIEFLKHYGLEFDNRGAYIELIKARTVNNDNKSCDCKSIYRFFYVLNESTEFLNFYSEHKNTKKATGEVIYHRIRYILPINDYINFNKYVNFIFHVEAGNWDY
jgi:hypothetical protein